MPSGALPEVITWMWGFGLPGNFPSGPWKAICQSRGPGTSNAILGPNRMLY